MKKIYIITDSTADLSQEYIKQKNIIMIPLTVTYKGVSYRDRIDINTEELLQMLKHGGELPKTSQINPRNFYDVYSKLIQEDCDIISIHISSGLSGTYQSAIIAKQMLNARNIHVIDSRSVSHGTGLLVMEAQKMAENGIDVISIVDRITELSKRLKVAFIVDTLEYLKKGGRLSGTQAAIGTLLNIKPIIHTDEGKLVIYDKARGMKKAQMCLINYIKQSDFDRNLGFAVGSIDYNETTLEFVKTLKNETGIEDIIKADVGTVVATYSGPGVLGVYFFKQ